ncbi:hypothetical protein CI610_03501 [invertebrate metagenome]|uniref:Uncharacterized protein n=1 Tax=invertebrate metagenome TaxID=1711999 RepID=A0A2H9T2W3_9ZZZZ
MLSKKAGLSSLGPYRANRVIFLSKSLISSIKKLPLVSLISFKISNSNVLLKRIATPLLLLEKEQNLDVYPHSVAQKFSTSLEECVSVKKLCCTLQNICQLSSTMEW